MKSLSPTFLSQNAATLQWSFALLIVDLIVGGFFANQGYWDIESRAAGAFFNFLSAYLYFCVLYRLAKPKGAEHAQVMMFLLLIPKTDIALNFLLQQILVAMIILKPFLNRFQICSLIVVAFTILPTATMLSDRLPPVLEPSSILYSPPTTTKDGYHISTTDRLYKLYRFDDDWHKPPTYRLLRVLPICPGLSLVKELTKINTSGSVQVVLSETGNYSIEEGNQRTVIEKEKEKSWVQILTPPVVPMLTDKRTRLAIFFTTQAKPLTWAMALIVVNLSIGGFFEQQGHWEFTNDNAAEASSYLSYALYTLTLFRLIKPKGVQDIQALILLLILPNSDSPLLYLGREILLVIILVFRWTRFSRIVGLTAVAATLIMASALMNCLHCEGGGVPYSPKNGELCSKTDNIYFLYRFPCGWYTNYAYGLFRQVPIIPGLQLIKRLDYINTDKTVCVCTTPEGNYIIVDGPPRDYRFRQ